MGLADVVEEAQEPYAAVYGQNALHEVSKRAASLTDRVKDQLKLQVSMMVTLFFSWYSIGCTKQVSAPAVVA